MRFWAFTRFGRYQSKNGEKAIEFDELIIAEQDEGRLKSIEAGVSRGRTMAEGAVLARDMVNEPANVMTPTSMAQAARRVADACDLSIEVLDNPQMKEMGMGAFMGVAQGSEEPAKLIVLRYQGDPDDPANNLGLVGKGITFDTGGISIKPAGGMEAMKGDMAGGASVIAAMQVIAGLKPKINVTGLSRLLRICPAVGPNGPATWCVP